MRLGDRLSHSSTSTPPNHMIVASLESQEASVQATSWMMSYAPLERSKCYIFPKVTNIQSIFWVSVLTLGAREFKKSLQEWNFEKGLLLRCGKIYVPKDQDICLELLWLHHDTTLAGHLGRWKMLGLLTRNYWWPGMSVNVKKYIGGCNKCQRNNPHTRYPMAYYNQTRSLQHPGRSSPWILSLNSQHQWTLTAKQEPP
jgi:hypothetical protein